MLYRGSRSSLHPAAEGLDYVALGKQTGKMAAEILKGEKTASEMNYETISEPGLYINTKAAEELGVTVDETLQPPAENFHPLSDPENPEFYM